MTAFYDGLSMRGSGEDSYTRVQTVGGEQCDWSGEEDVHVDDHGQGTWTCPECDTEQEVEV